jgi:arylsulfatase A-like enzyme
LSFPKRPRFTQRRTGHQTVLCLPCAQLAAQADFHFNNNLQVDAVRQGKWKLIPPGEFKPKVKRQGNGKRKRPASVPTPGQLYDLSTDLSEQVNLWDEHPEVVDRLTGRLEEYLEHRRSAPHTDDASLPIMGTQGPSI